MFQLNYNHLHYFHVAAREGSVGSAAKHLGVTQPTVSEQLRTLERALGVVLFERQPSGLKLSEAGRIAFEHTSVMFRAADRLRLVLDPENCDRTRIVRIGISGAVARSMASAFLIPLLGLDFLPVIRVVDCAELLPNLRASQLDLALCESPPPDIADLELSLIEETKLVAVAHPSLTPTADWSTLGLVRCSVGSRFRSNTDSFLERRGLRPRIVAEADDVSFLLDAAARGGHVAIVPFEIAREALEAGRVQLLETLDTGSLAIYGIYRSASAVDLVRRAVELLVQTRRAPHATQS